MPISPDTHQREHDKFRGTLPSETAVAVVNPDGSSIGGGASGALPVTRTATILNTETTSGAIDKDGYSLGLIRLPAAITGTTITFTASGASDGTFVPVYDQAGNLVTISGLAASRSVPLPYELAGARFIRLVMSAQAAERSIAVDLF